MSFLPVSKNEARLRMALTGVSGAGKTLGALLIAYGMTQDWTHVALLDSEHGRARFYADRDDITPPIGRFLYDEMQPPFSPERYIAAAREGARAIGADGVLIVDSLSHAWSGDGGVLDIKDRISGERGMNSYTAWSRAGKEHNELIDSLFSLPCHLIVTMRSKMAYELVETETGKKAPRKIGLQPIQRDDTEYEFDIVLDIGRDHIARASKDVTYLDALGQVITPELGAGLKVWLSDRRTEAHEGAPRCEACGAAIQPTKGRDGRMLSAMEVADAMRGATGGKAMCVNCFVKAQRAAQ